jgi:SAM-dependent methyltransferase
VSLAELIASLDDDTSIVAASALESSWSDKHSCRDKGCWGFSAYPVDLFRRILNAAVIGSGTAHPVFVDAGAGIGTKLLLAERAGCYAFGVEHNQHYVDEAVKLGARVTHGDVADLDYSDADIVWVNCPYRDPAEEIAFEIRLSAELKPGAVLCLANSPGGPPAGWELLTSVINRDGAWRKPGGHQ